MLRIHPSENAAAAKQYYRGGLTTSDYYIERGVAKGFWGGIAAKKLGLSGEVKPKYFDRLVDNLHPMTGEKLTPRTKAKRRAGYDFTFNAPKSVSIVYALSDFATRKAIRVAFEAAIQQTMYELEQRMHTRVRKNGKNTERQTGNMVWARFTHDTGRPLDGIPDPHLHTHCYVFNTTFDHHENRWKAGEFEPIKSSGAYFEAVFHNHFAGILHEQGFGISRTKSRWEITGIERKAIKAFSTRANLIDEIARADKITSPKEKSGLAAKTRQSKKSLKLPDVIHADWVRRYYESGSAPIDSIKEHRTKKNITIEQVVDYTIAHLFERQSTITTEKAMTTALRVGVGHVTQEQVYMGLHSRGALFQSHKGKEYMTMPHVLEEEQRVLAFVRQGRGRFKPFAPPDFRIARDFLNDSQQAAIKQLLASTDFVTAIQGKAGVGKTTVMQEIKDQLERQGKTMFAFAPSADAARNVLHKDGFDNATTLAKLLHDQTMQQRVKNSVVWLDEAGQTGMGSMLALLRIVRDQSARLILTGDTQQHGSVERGDAFRLMQQQAGLNTAKLDHILRQKPLFYRMAVDKVEKSIFGALEALHVMDAFREITDADGRYQTLADDYCRSILDHKSVLVVSPTHKEADYATHYIRERLKFAGIVGKKDYQHIRFKSLSSYFTEAEKQLSSSYTVGQVIQLNNNLPDGLMRGQAFTVLDHHSSTHLQVQAFGGQEQYQLPLAYGKRFDVYEPQPISLAKGDQIRVTKNSFAKQGRQRLNNGSHYTIERIAKNGDLVLTNGLVLDKDFPHVHHAYVTTSFASQGKTVDHMLIAQSRMSFGEASYKEQFYVSLSRGRHQVAIYTDDLKGLKKELTKNQQRLGASELIKEPAAKHSSWFGNMKQALRHYRHKVAEYTKSILPQFTKTNPAR